MVFKIVGRLAAVVLLLAGILLVIGFFLPRQYAIESRIQIAAPLHDVFAQCNDLNRWTEWSPWSPHRIPDLRIEVQPPGAGAGAVQTWTESRGMGKLWITHSEPNGRLRFIVEFAGFPPMECEMLFERAGENSTADAAPLNDAESAPHTAPMTGAPAAAAVQTLVVWRAEGQLPARPWSGWLVNLFQQGMQREFDQALARLKNSFESSEK
jgi:hypothetical protein